MKIGCTRRDIYFRQITQQNKNALARTHGESPGIFRFTLFDSSCDPSKWKSLCVSMPTWGESLTARVDNVNAAGSYAKVEPHFPRILKHSPYTGRAWCITIAGVKLRLCISGIPERADTSWCAVQYVERKFLRINYAIMENVCKIIALISYEMFRRLHCRCSRCRA